MHLARLYLQKLCTAAVVMETVFVYTVTGQGLIPSLPSQVFNTAKRIQAIHS